MTPSRLPRFSSPAEEARFWMEADSVDYWDVFRETGEPLELAPPLVRAIDQRSTSKRRISLYLDAWTIRLAQVLSERRGVPLHDIFREWVEEGIRARSAHP
jgi:hypothetical protein